MMKESAGKYPKGKRLGSYEISIAKPCNENWESMSSTDQGKFCSNCQKQVLDFSGLSDAAVVELINKSNGRICGRLNNSQLNRTVSGNQDEVKSVPFYSKIAAGFLMLGLFESQDSAASGDKGLKQVVYTVSSKPEMNLKKEKQAIGADSLKKVIEGVVKDVKSGEALSFVTVFVKDSKCGVLTNVDGRFKLVLPDSLISDSIFFKITYLGYRSLEYRISQNDLPFRGEFNLEPDQVLMTTGIMITTRRATFWEKVRHPFSWKKRRGQY